MSDTTRREHDALIAAGARSSEIAVFYALRARTDPKSGGVRDDLPTLARASGLSLRPFRKALRTLEAIGAVASEMRPRRGGPQGAAWTWIRRAQPVEKWSDAQVVRREEDSEEARVLDQERIDKGQEEAVIAAATTESLSLKANDAEPLRPREFDLRIKHPSSSSGFAAASILKTRLTRQAEEDETVPASERDLLSSARASVAQSVGGVGVRVLGPDEGGPCSSDPRGADDGAAPAPASPAKRWREIVRENVVPGAPEARIAVPNPKEVSDLIAKHSSRLTVLQRAPGWPYEEVTDALMLEEAERLHPSVDLAFEVGQFYWWRVDHPDRPPTRRGFRRFIDAAGKYAQRGAEAQREWLREHPVARTKVQSTATCSDTDDEQVRAVLVELKDIPDYPYDEAKDNELIRQIVKEHPRIDVLDAMWRWDTYLCDNPLTERDSPRASLRSLVRNLISWGNARQRRVISP